MAVLMILATNVLTRKTCEYLLKSGHLTRKSGYESIGIVIVFLIYFSTRPSGY